MSDKPRRDELSQILTDLREQGYKPTSYWTGVPRSDQFIRYFDKEGVGYLVTVGGSTTELLVEILKPISEPLKYKRNP